jgi:hypothetical protein
MKPALGIDRLGGGVRALVVGLEQHRARTSISPLSAILTSTPGAGLPTESSLISPIRLQADVGAGFGLAVELLEVDADRAIEAEQVGTDRGAGGVGDADAAHAEHVLQRPVDSRLPSAYCRRSPNDTGLPSRMSAPQRLPRP